MREGGLLHSRAGGHWSARAFLTTSARFGATHATLPSVYWSHVTSSTVFRRLGSDPALALPGTLAVGER